MLTKPQFKNFLDHLFWHHPLPEVDILSQNHQNALESLEATTAHHYWSEISWANKPGAKAEGNRQSLNTTKIIKSENMDGAWSNCN